MTQTICILGRQPALGIAELESLFGSESVKSINDISVIINAEPQFVPFDRLGGCVKLGRLLTILKTTRWEQIEKYLFETAPEHTNNLPEGKMTIGISVYGINVKTDRINATALGLKKAIKSTGRPIRIVPNKTPDLSSAQVLHNNLTGDRAWELLIVRSGNQTYLAQTTRVQDINAYASRDQARPKRDARVGMLPPKLAQIIINLAVGRVQTNAPPQSTTCNLQTTILDPFCGTGVLLQEAVLMGYDAIGTDLDQRMIDYSQTNLDWLASRYQLSATSYHLSQADATNYDWSTNSQLVVACETYLGRPFTSSPAPQVLDEVMHDVDTIHKKFLRNVAKQTKPGQRMCLAVPAWSIGKSKEHGARNMENSGLRTQDSELFKHLPVLDSLQELGYTRAVFNHVETSELIYHRPDQIVARELVVLIRKADSR